jgi:hypothetical protein
MPHCGHRGPAPLGAHAPEVTGFLGFPLIRGIRDGMGGQSVPRDTGAKESECHGTTKPLASLAEAPCRTGRRRSGPLRRQSVASPTRSEMRLSLHIGTWPGARRAFGLVGGDPIASRLLRPRQLRPLHSLSRLGFPGREGPVPPTRLPSCR